MGSSTAPTDSLLAGHEIIRTDKLERMNDMLAGVYRGRIVSAKRGSNPFYGEAKRIQFEHIGFDYCAYGADVEVNFPEAAAVRQQICLGGGGETIVQRRRALLSEDAASVIAPGRAVTTRFDAGYRQLVLRVDAAALRRKLEALVGADLPQPIEFRLEQTFDNPQLQALRRAALFFASQADALADDASRLARLELEEALVAAFLVANAHNYSYLLRAPPPDLTPRQVWLAELFIEANWDQPLTVEALSAAVGVGVRSIFKSFKDFRGYTPMAFAKEVRLRRARQMLSDGAATVTTVASRCGYQNHGYFARQYRGRFGESPSATLARARRVWLG